MATLGLDIGGSSVKAAAIAGSASCARSDEYDNPSPEQVRDAVVQAIERLPRSEALSRVGLCAPGVIDDSSRVLAAVNMPRLEGARLDEIVRDALRRAGIAADPTLPPLTDARAAAHDAVRTLGLGGRVLAVSIGTGVGACLLADARPVVVTGRGPGHFGQIDVTLDNDTGDGTLESYIGLRALRARYAPDLHAALARPDPLQPHLRALARALRIAHALFRPSTIILLGGTGIALRPAVGVLHSMTSARLTRVADPDWRLLCGMDVFHAARGAARLVADPEP
jgi:predicted NBD/HSP70 family sugar kinase